MTIYSFLTLNISLFVIALWGLFVIRKNLLVILLAIELMALSISLNFLVYSTFLDDLVGQIIALLVLTVVGSESAVGLALLLVLYRAKADISIDVVSSLKG